MIVGSDKKIKLFLVGDDTVYMKSLEMEFMQHANFLIETFTTGEDCLAALPHKPDLIILDYLLDVTVKNVMSGIEVLDRIKAFDKDIPVIMLSAQDKSEAAFDCMHHQAFVYEVKSETSFMRLLKIISIIFQYRKMEKQLHWYMDRM